MSDERRPRDVDELLHALQTPPAPAEAPAWPDEDEEEADEVVPLRPDDAQVPWPVLVAAFAVAAVAVFAVLYSLPEPGAPGGVTLRGDEGVAAVTVDLRLVVERDGTAQRVERGVPLSKGEIVHFRVAASEAVEVQVRVDGPEGAQTITEVRSGPELTDLRGEEGLIGYRLERTGRYVFTATAGETDACEAPACVEFPVEVE